MAGGSRQRCTHTKGLICNLNLGKLPCPAGTAVVGAPALATVRRFWIYNGVRYSRKPTVWLAAIMKQSIQAIWVEAGTRADLQVHSCGHKLGHHRPRRALADTFTPCSFFALLRCVGGRGCQRRRPLRYGDHALLWSLHYPRRSVVVR